MMIIMGIDPGIANVGFGVIQSRHRKIHALIFGTLRTNPRTILSTRIYSIARRIDILIYSYNPDIVVVEDFVVGFRRFGNQAIANNISKVFGAIVYVIRNRDVSLEIKSPNVWMREYLHLKPRTKFSKMYLRKTVERELGIITKVEHEAEALAMALNSMRRRQC